MTIALLSVAVCIIIGTPLILYAVIRIGERAGRMGWFLLLFGIAVIVIPITYTLVLQQSESGRDRYIGR